MNKTRGIGVDLGKAGFVVSVAGPKDAPPRIAPAVCSTVRPVRAREYPGRKEPPMEAIDLQALRFVVREVMQEEMGMGRYSLAPRFEGGTLLLQPADPAMKPKEIPAETFFKKVTSVREKLRVLEQKVNNSKSLSQTERLEFQTLITRAYGSLTTFNVLFKEEEDRFQGSKV